ASWIYAKCPLQIPTTAVATAAVVASGDGSCPLLYNPDFFVQLGLEGVKFVLFHESRHLVHRHLFADPELRADPVFALAAEVAIDAAVSSALLNSLLAARRGHPGAERELRDLMDRTDGTSEHATRAWGRLGAGALRGETPRTARVDWWQRWLVDVLASKLREG